jgi:hypothetical protein
VISASRTFSDASAWFRSVDSLAARLGRYEEEARRPDMSKEAGNGKKIMRMLPAWWWW